MLMLNLVYVSPVQAIYKTRIEEWGKRRGEWGREWGMNRGMPIFTPLIYTCVMNTLK